MDKIYIIGFMLLLIDIVDLHKDLTAVKAEVTKLAAKREVNDER